MGFVSTKHFLLKIILFLYFSRVAFFFCRLIHLMVAFQVTPFGGIGGPERTVIFVCFGDFKLFHRGSFWPAGYLLA